MAGILSEAIFEDAGLYSDGPPTWNYGRDRRACESSKDADERRETTASWILAHAADHQAALELYDRLAACSLRARCRSAACPACSRAFTRWFVATSASALRPHRDEIRVLSVVDARHAVPVGRLNPAVLHASGMGIANALKSLGVATSLLAVDLSVNESADGEFDPHWQPQAWIFAPAAQVDPVRKAIRAAIPATHTVPRPVKVQTWDGNPAALAYALKAEFARRVSVRKPADGGRGRGACRNTRDRPLRVDQRRELLIALDRAGFQARLHLRGFRLTKTADGPRIRLIAGTSA